MNQFITILFNNTINLRNFGIFIGGCIVGTLLSYVAFLYSKSKLLKDLQACHINLDHQKNAYSALEARLHHNETMASQREAFLSLQRDEISTHLKALCAEALQTQSRQFLELAQSRLDHVQHHQTAALNQHKLTLEHLLGPLATGLNQLDLNVKELEKSRSTAYQSLQYHLQDVAKTQQALYTQTSSLTRILATPHLRGKWGEMQLRRLVETAGMLPYCDFEEQVTLVQGSELQRPDLVVTLPGNKKIVIDAKVPLSAYLQAQDNDDPQEHKKKIKEHARQLRQHITHLSARRYWEQLHPAPEFVLLFLPMDVVLTSALETEPDLLELALKSHVILTTPTTLIALLKTLGLVWQQEKAAENITELLQISRKVYNNLGDVHQYFEKLGRQLHLAMTTYNQYKTLFEKKISSPLQQLEVLGLRQNDSVVDGVHNSVKEPEREVLNYSEQSSGEAL